MTENAKSQVKAGRKVRLASWLSTSGALAMVLFGSQAMIAIGSPVKGINRAESNAQTASKGQVAPKPLTIAQTGLPVPTDAPTAGPNAAPNPQGIEAAPAAPAGSGDLAPAPTDAPTGVPTDTPTAGPNAAPNPQGIEAAPAAPAGSGDLAPAAPTETGAPTDVPPTAAPETGAPTDVPPTAAPEAPLPTEPPSPEVTEPPSPEATEPPSPEATEPPASTEVKQENIVFVSTVEGAATAEIAENPARFSQIVGSGRLLVNADNQVTGYYFTVSGLPANQAVPYHFHVAKTGRTPTSCEGDKEIVEDETGGEVLVPLSDIAPLQAGASGVATVGSASSPIQLPTPVALEDIGYLNIHATGVTPPSAESSVSEPPQTEEMPAATGPQQPTSGPNAAPAPPSETGVAPAPTESPAAEATESPSPEAATATDVPPGAVCANVRLNPAGFEREIGSAPEAAEPSPEPTVGPNDAPNPQGIEQSPAPTEAPIPGPTEVPAPGSTETAPQGPGFAPAPAPAEAPAPGSMGEPPAQEPAAPAPGAGEPGTSESTDDQNETPGPSTGTTEGGPGTPGQPGTAPITP